jgi:CRP-like cAMP-binding protein
MEHGKTEDWLQKVPLFQGLSKKQLRLVSSLATRLNEPAGTILTKEGRQGHEFIIVLEGEIEVRKGDRIIATRGPGTYVGEIALLDKRPRTATVIAKTPVVIEVIGQREFRGLLGETPELADEILATMAQRLAELETPVDA